MKSKVDYIAHIQTTAMQMGFHFYLSSEWGHIEYKFQAIYEINITLYQVLQNINNQVNRFFQ